MAAREGAGWRGKENVGLDNGLDYKQRSSVGSKV